MKILIALFVMISMISCQKNVQFKERLSRYNSVLDRCDKVRIFRKGNINVELIKELSGDELLDLRKIFKNGVEPIDHVPTEILMQYDFIRNGMTTGRLRIGKSMVDFQADTVLFSFRLPYGIGTYPMNIGMGW